MTGISTLRLTVLRAMYAFIALGLAITRWPDLLNPPTDAMHMDTVVASMLGAVSLLALLGIRYPVRMLPLLFFEFVWKSIWVLQWGIDGQLTPDQQRTLVACLMGIIPIPLVVPWGYVFTHFVTTPADSWRTVTTSQRPSEPSSTTPVSTPQAAE